jgi:hypothetical protein
MVLKLDGIKMINFKWRTCSYLNAMMQSIACNIIIKELRIK